VARGRVLLVDDEPNVLDTLRDMVAALGYDSIPVGSGQAAIAALAEKWPHVVLLDLMMPGMSGLEVLAFIQEHHRYIPVIVVTGAAEESRDAVAAGAMAVIAKPYQVAVLAGVLERAMEIAGPQ
jgi:CheY-like chemotaxis protein